MQEKFVVENVREYLNQLQQKLPVPTAVPTAIPTDLYSIKTEHTIQIGSSNCRADVVLLKEDLPLIWEGIQTNRFIVIVECKAVGKEGNGIDQLKSYLCATDTRFGIFAANPNSDKWKYYQNLRHNNFRPISRQKFEAQVGLQENAEADKEKEAERRIEHAIEIRSKCVEKELTHRYERKKANLQTNMQRQLNEKRSEGFWSGFWYGFWSGVFAIIVFVILQAIVSGG